MKDNIYLIGFMGTGKSTVSKSLAKLLGYGEIDTDAWIVRQQNKSIAEIFELQKEKHKIISCGGGMAMRKENVTLMQKNGVVVLLTAQPETILERVKNDQGRPVLNGNMNVKYIERLLAQRSPFYQAAGEVVVPTDHRAPDDIAQEIKKNLEFFKNPFDF